MKKRTLISLILNSIIVLTTFIAWGIMFIPSGPEFMATGWSSLRYFTVLSNIFCAITSIFMIVVNIKKLKNEEYKCPKYIFLLRYISTISVSLTFTTVVIFLGPVWQITGAGSYFSMFARESFVLHLTTPVLSIISIINFELDYKLSNKEMILGLAPTILYSLVYFINVVITKVWPDFYFFTFGGHNSLIPVSMIFMYGLTFLLCYIETKNHNKKIH